MDPVRQAKGNFAVAPLCPDKSMAPVLAIIDVVARDRDINVAVPSTPLERVFNLSSPGRTGSLHEEGEQRCQGG